MGEQSAGIQVYVCVCVSMPCVYPCSVCKYVVLCIRVFVCFYAACVPVCICVLYVNMLCCVCVCGGACKTTQACVRGPEVRLWYYSSGIVHFRFLRQGLSLTWNSLKQTRLARDAQETVFISLPSAGIRSACCHIWLVECGF